MKTSNKLTKGEQIACIELEKSKVLSRLIKTVSAVLAVLLIAVGCLFLPVNELTNMSEPFEHLFVLMLALFSVSIVHELIRGFLMRVLSGVKPVIRFSGSYLHAGCEALFSRKKEQLLNLAPLVLMTAACVVFLLTVADNSWKWMVWIVLTVSLCTCVGDVYASVRFMQMPSDILIENIGATYLVFSPKKAAPSQKAEAEQAN